MNCAETKPLVHAYVDDELDVVISLQVEQHIDTCEQCTADLIAHRRLRTSLQNASMRHAMPVTLERRVRSAVGAGAKRRPSRLRFSYSSAIAAAAAIFLAIGAFVLVANSARSRSDQLASAVLSSHVRSLMIGQQHLIDVVSTDKHTVKPWFDGRIDFAPVVNDFSAEGFPLIGGRIDYVDSRAVAAVVYQAKKHVINLLQWPSRGPAGDAEKTASEQGYNLIHWTQGGMQFWAISDLNPGELEDFCRLVRAHAPPTH